MSWYNPGSWNWGKANPFNWGDESESAKAQRGDLKNQADQADAFRDQAQAGYGSLTTEAGGMRDMLRRQATGENSLSAEQLRQGLQQQQASQMSMAAGAAPQNAAMAARTGAIQMGRNQATMAGQAAMAGIAERQAALKAWQDAILEQRRQDASTALGAGQNAINATTGQKAEGSTLEKWGGAVSAGLGYAAGKK